MSSVLALPYVYEAIVAKLRTDAALMMLLDKGVLSVFNVAPQGAAFPYIEVGLGTEEPFDTMGPVDDKKWGSNMTVQITARTQSSGSGSDLPALKILDRAKQVLVGKELTVVGFPSSIVSFEGISPIFTDVVDGRQTRTGALIVRVRVHQGER